MPETFAPTTTIGIDSPDPRQPVADGSRVSLPPEAFKFDLDHTAIFLDVDGTLLDIAPTPLEVSVPERLRESLEALWKRLDGSIAFISGRPIAEIDRIFEPLRLPAAGGHGAEIRFTPKGEVRRSRSASLDDELRGDFALIGRLGPGIMSRIKAIRSPSITGWRRNSAARS